MNSNVINVLLGMSIALTVSLAQGCSDKHQHCTYWTSRGYCKAIYEDYMRLNCMKSCNHCGGGSTGSGGSGGSCGVKPNVRIVGGTEAPKGAWPWQVMIRTRSGFPFCGGSLVHPKWVVTASHCIVNKQPSSLHVRLGAHYRTTNMGSEQDINIVRIIKHPSYGQPKQYANDIALLELSKPAVLRNGVGLVCIPQDSSPLPDNKKCWVTGWGRLSSGGTSPKVLMQVSVPLVSRSRCDRAYPRKIHDSMVCAGRDEGGIDSCQGDSGGPMVCEYNGKYYLDGVVSWGYGCAAPGKFGVYAKVRHLKQFVEKYIKNY